MPHQRRGSLRNFQPSPGLITAYHPPGGPGVRVDTHVYAGYTVPPYYDSLLAKVIVHGNDRAEALRRMDQALDSFILEGVTTTIPFLARVIRHPDFVAGKVDTRFLERESQLLRAGSMKLDVVFTPPGLLPADVPGRTVFVIDILRATSAMCAALAQRRQGGDSGGVERGGRSGWRRRSAATTCCSPASGTACAFPGSSWATARSK